MLLNSVSIPFVTFCQSTRQAFIALPDVNEDDKKFKSDIFSISMVIKVMTT